ncbi:MAG: PIN domain-containing protein [Firmicutes bacterium]|nr:PIN domain-containing protein [Bacillota bacterium]
MAAFVAFLDACVLFPPNLRDVIVTVAEVGICQIRWSPDVLDELQRTVVRRAKVENADTAEWGAQYLRRVMEEAFPDAMVDRALYEWLIDAMPNDPKDRHVLAAAIASGADVLVTANQKHFAVPPGFCRLEIQHPDAFLGHQLELAPREFFEALQQLATERRAPMDSVPAILESLRKTVPRFARQAKALWSEFQG